MSAEAVQRFWRQAEGDGALRRALEEILVRRGERVVADGDAVVGLAAKHGFVFTRAELQAHVGASRPDGRLSDAELESVAGGLIFNSITWVFGSQHAGGTNF